MRDDVMTVTRLAVADSITGKECELGPARAALVFAFGSPSGDFSGSFVGELSAMDLLATCERLGSVAALLAGAERGRLSALMALAVLRGADDLDAQAEMAASSADAEMGAIFDGR